MSDEERIAERIALQLKPLAVGDIVEIVHPEEHAYWGDAVFRVMAIDGPDYMLRVIECQHNPSLLGHRAIAHSDYDNYLRRRVP